MIFVVHGDHYEDRQTVRNFLISRYGMTPVEADRLLVGELAHSRFQKIFHEASSDYVVSDALTMLDVELLAVAGAVVIYVSRSGECPQALPPGRSWFVQNDSTVDELFRRVTSAIVDAIEHTGKASTRLRVGIHRSEAQEGVSR